MIDRTISRRWTTPPPAALLALLSNVLSPFVPIQTAATPANVIQQVLVPLSNNWFAPINTPPRGITFQFLGNRGDELVDYL